MTAEARPGFLDAVRALKSALNETRLPWAVIGGVAVIARGVARFTADVDATLWAPNASLDEIVGVLAGHEIRPRMDGALEFARARHVVLLRHEPSGLPIDLSLAWLPFEDEAIQRAEICDYAGVPIPVARPEDLVIYKVVAARPRDLDDAERLLLLHGPAMDVGRLRRVVREFAEALEDPARMASLEQLLARTGLDRER